MAVSLVQFGATLLFLGLSAGSPGTRVAACDDPLPIDPGVVTREMKLTGFRGTRALGPACRLSWEGGTQPGLLIYGPSSLAAQVQLSQGGGRSLRRGGTRRRAARAGCPQRVHGFRSKDSQPTGLRRARAQSVHDRLSG
jgi:hypothetical protein